MFIEVQNLGAAATELAKPLIDRILSVNPHEQPEIIKDLDMGIRGLPPGAISTITDQIKKLAQTPDTRGLAWITISRLGEAGETAIPTYIELIQAPASQYARPHLNDQQALKGALLGLCQMEHLAVKAKPALIEYVQTPHQQNKSPLINETTGLLAYETIAMTTLVNTMPEEEYKQLFRRTLSESRLQHYISRARDKRCFY